MTKKVHILGNGDLAQMMPQGVRDGSNRDGKLICCNQPPFAVKNPWCTTIVDFKMCAALTEGSINLDAFYWVMGNRPRLWMDKNPNFYLRHSHHIREFYATVPKYCGKSPNEAATAFNCGHMATHYAAKRLVPDEIHMYGFDSIFDHNMRSYTDVVLNSDRSKTNNYRLLDVWRPIWNHIFHEFKDITFVLHHKHPNPKIKTPKNVEFFTGS